MFPLPPLAELGDGLRRARRDEDRVVTEACLAALFGRNRSFENARAGELLAVGRKRHEHRHHPSAAVVLAREPLEQRERLVAFRPTRRTDARRAVERFELDPGVLAQHPVARLALPAEARLEARVLLVGRTGLVGPAAPLERL